MALPSVGVYLLTTVQLIFSLVLEIRNVWCVCVCVQDHNILLVYWDATDVESIVCVRVDCVGDMCVHIHRKPDHLSHPANQSYPLSMLVPTQMEEAHGTIFMSMPSLLDPTLAPDGCHVLHAFTPDWIDAWQGLEPDEYERKKVWV